RPVRTAMDGAWVGTNGSSPGAPRFRTPVFQSPRKGHERKAMKQPSPRAARPTGGETIATFAVAALALSAIMVAACNGGEEKRSDDASVPLDAAGVRSSAVDRPIDQGSSLSPLGVACAEDADCGSGHCADGVCC